MTLTGNPRVAVVFFTHQFHGRVLDHLRRLQAQCADHGRFFVLHDGSSEVPAFARPFTHVFDFEGLKSQYPRILGTTLIPGNPHLAHIDFARAHAEFDQFWIIEYDAFFSGSWAVLFEAFRGMSADLVCCHVRRREQEPSWYWWPSLRPPPGTSLGPADCYRGFFPIVRLSRRALELVAARQREGWSGHFEALVPTLLRREGLGLVDIGGEGEFVPPGFTRRFYTSSSGSSGLGTMRYRPCHVFAGARRDFLYHPVKDLDARGMVDAARASARAWARYAKARIQAKIVKLKERTWR